MPFTLTQLVRGESPSYLVGGVHDSEDGTWFPPVGWSSASERVRPNEETIGVDYLTLIESAYKRNGIVFACQQARALPFTEARFAYQEIVGGRPGDLVSASGLELLESPWPGGTTGELLARMEQDGGMAGNFFAAVIRDRDGRGVRLRRLRPDWVRIVTMVDGDVDGGPDEVASQVVGYIYAPPKRTNRRAVAPTMFPVDDVVHYSPIPDPSAHWRGMSWLTPVLPEIRGDQHATEHKSRFFKNGAALSLAVKYDPSISPDSFRQFVEQFETAHRGSENAYKTLHIGGGADPVPIGVNLKDLDFSKVQGAGETRIAAAAGVGAIIARLSEGMQGSSLNQGNYGAAKRQFADMTLRPLWRMAAASLQKITTPPVGHRLWTDTRDVAFLAEDSKDEANIFASNAQTIRTLIDAGYEPDAVIAAVQSGDMARLRGQHTGLFSVQLQAAGSQPEATL